ncbi:Pesticin receptor [Zhongshania aliphaticivorans]|uniref:Pesticin receptor n=1 Tax=Zhongshania aliphaticivorans TaxID=1470434 RepID=A0A5S9QKB9_9GAMM|nr:TonB-dependent receptor [Zhongshania aliphaticivorans]CAA0111175.1 Pesticin receptor [Zhongshania aliphaticivorans]CAA0118494.1 Pesticin receptor [Zhongshania aliphaticivorans]
MRVAHSNFSKNVSCVLTIGVSSLLSFPSFAETNTRNRMLEEVVVTAQKREENSQEVPITMAALGGEKLEAFGIEATADLEKIVPGLTFTQQYGYTVIYLRGVGSESFLPNSEPSIASYVDGINIASAHGKSDAVGPVERIEVLKGPQGTLYGRSATGGAINIISKPVPTEGYEGFLTYGAGNYDDRHIQGYFAAALTDRTGMSFSYYKDQRDNLNVRTIRGEVQHDDKQDFSESFRLKVTQTIGDNISITGIAQKTDVQLADADKKANIHPSGLSIGADPQEPGRIVENDKQGLMRTDAELYGLIFEWDLDAVAFKFVYSDQESLTFDRTTTDYDGTSLNKVSFFTYDEPVFQETYEFQLSSTDNSWMSDKLTWVAGYYHLEGGGGFERIFFELSPELATGLVTGLAGSIGDLLTGILSPVTSTPVFLEAGGKITIDSDSVFAEATYSITPDLNLTLGARYQEETRGLINSYFDVINPLFGTPSEEYLSGSDQSNNIRVATYENPDLEDTSVAPRLAIQWFPSESVQIYSSIAKGFKSQTYNVLNFFSAPDEVDKSETTSVELGFKSDLLDSALRLNGAVFNTVTKNPISAFVGLTSGGVVNYFNAKESTTKGAEIDFLFQPMPSMNPGLVLSGGASYIEAEFTDFEDGRGYDEETGLAYGPGAITLLGARDFTGNDVPRTPKFSSNIALNQAIELGDFGYLELAVDYAFKDSFFYTASNTPHAKQPQYELFGARISWMYDPKGITLTAYVNNIKDEDYFVQMAENDFGVSAALAPPRLYGAKIKVEF